MADTTGFSHITVCADDDDDVVIQAGIAETAPEPDAAQPAEEAGEAAGEPEPSSESEAEAAAHPASEPEPAAADEPADVSEPEAPRSRAARDDGYRETTLADIEGSSMSNTQKAVIVVALLGIIAFVAWYLFAR